MDASLLSWFLLLLPGFRLVYWGVENELYTQTTDESNKLPRAAPAFSRSDVRNSALHSEGGEGKNPTDVENGGCVPNL